MIEEKIYTLIVKWLKSFEFPEAHRKKLDEAYIVQAARNKTRKILALIRPKNQ